MCKLVFTFTLWLHFLKLFYTPLCVTFLVETLCKIFSVNHSQLVVFITLQATLNTLNAAKKANVGHFVLLSAFCVKKPLLQVSVYDIHAGTCTCTCLRTCSHYSYMLVLTHTYYHLRKIRKHTHTKTNELRKQINLHHCLIVQTILQRHTFYLLRVSNMNMTVSECETRIWGSTYQSEWRRRY